MSVWLVAGDAPGRMKMLKPNDKKVAEQAELAALVAAYKQKVARSTALRMGFPRTCASASICVRLRNLLGFNSVLRYTLYMVGWGDDPSEFENGKDH